MTTLATTSIVQAHFAASIAAAERFFAREAPLVAEGCLRLAERFAAGGTLYLVGTGPHVSDAHHVAVEFVHPVIVGKRALPAMALTSDAGVMTGISAEDLFAAPLRVLGRPADMLLAFSSHRLRTVVDRALAVAREQGLLTLVVETSDAPVVADVVFAVGCQHPLVAQEVGETLYHVLWELVHVFLDAREPHVATFLPERGPALRDRDLIDHVIASTRDKARDVIALRQTVLGNSEAALTAAAAAMAPRIARGGRLFAFGNGGSATDAQDAAADAMLPAMPGWRALPAVALTNDVGVVTAVGNDVGFDHIFARQLGAFAREDDVALAFSTSGVSRNLLAGMAEAKRRGLLTLAFTGGDGGALARSRDVDFNVTAPSEHLPRIQEAHATAWHALLSAVQEALS